MRGAGEGPAPSRRPLAAAGPESSGQEVGIDDDLRAALPSLAAGRSVVIEATCVTVRTDRSCSTFDEKAARRR